MTEERKSFTVNDRRHFTAEGDTREPEEEAAPASSEAVPPQNETPRATSGPRASQAAEPADFTQFLLSLGAQAGYLLTPQEGSDRSEALVGARSIISILEMLKDKTEGRRTDEEERVLEGLLYELRMAYVAAAREGGT
jgi:uncharacterized protein DUF1844